ncbi:hypothetical protein [Deinococcus marmoris]|uniref:hypothetical protein n=1 Tax=Deinococcus marmoris TaxID=249408 RepID=UPI00096A5747|nr:hypothetical protein [Deinococcus marmoris]
MLPFGLRLTRPALIVLGLMVLLTACSWGRDARSAQATEQAVIDAARDAMTTAAKILGGSELMAGARWYKCPGGIGHQYVGGGVMTAPKGDVSRQLEAVRAAVIGAGFTDVTQVEGKVSVERDDISVTLGYRAVDQHWRVSSARSATGTPKPKCRG